MNSHDFWASINATCAQLEHERNLRGKTRAKCVYCNGTGHSEPGRSDCDAHGSYWVSAVPCRSCSGHGGRYDHEVQDQWYSCHACIGPEDLSAAAECGAVNVDANGSPL